MDIFAEIQSLVNADTTVEEPVVEAPVEEPTPEEPAADEPSVETTPADEPFVAAVVAPAPLVGGVTTKKRHHRDLILEGVTTKCAHCNLALTDAMSMQAGMGPICRGKGYHDEPDQPDEIMAMASLSDYPELVDFLVQNYKPKGIPGLMNGLVRVCSLNRKTEVHDVCTNAIEMLGYRKLASTLRDSLAVVEVRDDANYPDNLVVWVKKTAWSWRWTYALRARGYYFNRAAKGVVIPKTDRRFLWDTMISHFNGLCCRVKVDGSNKTVRITPKTA